MKVVRYNSGVVCTVHAGLFEILINVFVVQSRKELLSDGSHNI